MKRRTIRRMPDTPNTEPEILKKLTARQQRIARLAARGSTGKEIATVLGISLGNVKTTLSKYIYPKFGVSSQAAFIRRWVDVVEQRGDCSTCPLRQNAKGGAEGLVSID